MTWVAVGSAANSGASREQIVINLSGEAKRISPKQARWLAERIDDELALLDGGEVRPVDAVDAPEVSDDERADINQFPGDEMGAPEYQIGDELPDGVSNESTEDTSEESNVQEDEQDTADVLGLDELTALSGIGERKIHLLADDGFSDLADIHEASVDAVAIDGVISENSATKISRFAAEALSSCDEDTTDDAQAESEEEDATDDDPIESGNERERVTEGSSEPDDPDRPFSCPVIDCRKRFDNREDRRTHRDADHDQAAVMRGYRERARDDLVDDVSVLDVEQAAIESNATSDVAKQLDVANADARKWLNMLQLGDVLDTANGMQAVKAVEDLHETLEIDEPLPNRPDQGGSA